MLVARLLVLGIVGLVMAVRLLPQPWRGIVDAGVVVGLAIGITSIVHYTVVALLGRPLPIPPDVPQPATPAPAGSN